jgi:hypothetical protein
MVNTRHGFRKFFVIWLLGTLFSVTIWGLTLLATPSTAVNLPASVTTLHPCDVIKGRTYIAFTIGEFDGHRNAAAAGKWTFDSGGRGTGRTLRVLEPTDQTVLQQTPTAACTRLSDSVGVLSFTVGSTGAGSSNFTVHDNGAKLWVEPNEEGRPMKGWLLELPPPSVTKR